MHPTVLLAVKLNQTLMLQVFASLTLLSPAAWVVQLQVIVQIHLHLTQCCLQAPRTLTVMVTRHACQLLYADHPYPWAVTAFYLAWEPSQLQNHIISMH